MPLPKRCVRKQFDFRGQSVKLLKPFLLTFKVLGIFANDISGNRLKRCSKPFYSICVLWVSLYVSYICLITSFFVIALMAHPMELYLTIGLVTQTIGYISLSMNSIAAYSSQNLFGKVRKDYEYFDRLDSYDHEVARMAKNRRDSFWIPWIAGFLTIIVVLCLITEIISDASSHPMVFIVHFGELFTLIMHMFGTLEVFLILYLILIRFKHLNEEIIPHVLWNEEHLLSIGEQRRPKTIKISNVKVLYFILYDSQQTFNDIYSTPLLFSFASLMLEVLTNVRIYAVKSALETSVFLIPPIMQLFILCAIAHYTAEEANKIPCVLSKRMNALVNSEETMGKIGTLTYFLHNRVTFDAAGYFTIDLPLFYSIVATIATYFMLLI